MTDERLLARIEQAKKNRPRVVGVAEAVEEYLHYAKYDGCFCSIIYLDQESGDVWTETKWAGNEPKPKYESEPAIIRLFDFVREYLGIEPTLDENEESGIFVRNVTAWANLCARMYDAIQKQEQEESV